MIEIGEKKVCDLKQGDEEIIIGLAKFSIAYEMDLKWSDNVFFELCKNKGYPHLGGNFNNDDGNWIYSDLVEFNPGNKIKFVITGSRNDLANFIFYDKDENIILELCANNFPGKSIGIAQEEALKGIIVSPKETAYLRICGSSRNNVSQYVLFEQ